MWILEGSEDGGIVGSDPLRRRNRVGPGGDPKDFSRKKICAQKKIFSLFLGKVKPLPDQVSIEKVVKP